MKKRKISAHVISRLSIEISGKSEILICGCTGITYYSETEVGLLSPEGEVSVGGEKLTMRWAGEGKLLIDGKISAVNFL